MANLYDLFESDDPDQITDEIMGRVEEIIYADRHSGSDYIIQLMEELEERVRYLAEAA